MLRSKFQNARPLLRGHFAQELFEFSLLKRVVGLKSNEHSEQEEQPYSPRGQLKKSPRQQDTIDEDKYQESPER